MVIKKIMQIGNNRLLTVPRIVLGGAVLFGLTVVLAGRIELAKTAELARGALDTLKNQCSGYERIIASDRTKSLFRLTDMMRDFSNQMKENPEDITDEYLEQYVDDMRLSGVAILDENLMLEASGYTQRFRDSEWMNTSNGSLFADILEHPVKVFAERMHVNDEYYDICAVARKDAPGIIIGFYRQPTGLITNTENDLESLLNGLKLEREGNYVITENDVVRVSSDVSMQDESLQNSGLLRQLNNIESDGKLHLFRDNTRYRWGIRDGYAGYKLYIYYPVFSPISSAVVAGAVAVIIYAVLVLLLVTVRNRALFENQKQLRQSNHELTETVKMLKSLETIYFSIYRVDLPGDRYDTISVSGYLKDKIPSGGTYTELRKFYLENMTVAHFREDVDFKMSKEYIQHILSRENITDVRKSFYTDFQAMRDGQIKWCRVSVTVVDFDEKGKPMHVLILLQDVDKEKTKEAEYQTRILDESQKARMANNAKTEFLRRISHDIRTPLNGIRGYIEMGSREPGNEALQKYCQDKATIALNTMFELVNSVLEMSDMEGHDVQVEEIPFQLDALLNEVDTVVKPQAISGNIYCQILPEKALPENNLIGSPRHVTQILMNLASNGVKFGKQNGSLRMEIRTILKTENRITYEFCFADDGIGMSEEFQKHIFEPFVQETTGARSSYEGSGLGLAIVKKLVDALGGTISFRSVKDAGTEFRVRLPFRIDHNVCHSDKADKGESKEKSGAQCLKDVHILLAEDNELNMEIAEFFLTDHGAQVTKAWNGKEAVNEFLASREGEFDLILTDVMMPVLDGLDECRMIRAAGRRDSESIPIAAMSANVLEEDIRRSRAAGMNAHIAKPIDEKKLLETILTLLHKAPD